MKDAEPSDKHSTGLVVHTLLVCISQVQVEPNHILCGEAVGWAKPLKTWPTTIVMKGVERLG
jgi:hypothetical protein